MLYCVKILKYFLPIALAFFSGMEAINYNLWIYSIISVGFFLYIHYIVNIEHNRNNGFIFFGIFAFVIFDLQQSAILGVNLIPFCLASAVFCYVADKKYFSRNRWNTIIAVVIYIVCHSFINYCISNYLDLQLLVFKFCLIAG